MVLDLFVYVCCIPAGRDGYFQYTSLKDKGVYILTVAGTLTNGTVKTVSNTFRSGTKMACNHDVMMM